MTALNLSGPHIFGVDVSRYQEPKSLKWSDMKAAGCEFVIVRATYGTKVDVTAAEHVKRARDAGVRCGMYHFYRPTQLIDAQFEAFKVSCDLAGYGLPTDIVPAVDLEADTVARPVKPEHAEGAETFTTLLKLNFGRPCLCYITQADWRLMGKPGFVLQLPQWNAHYSAASRTQPATPNGIQYAIWQNRVGRFAPKGPHGYYKDESPQIDHNHARWLPLLDGTKITPIDALSSRDVLGSERHLDEVDKTNERRSSVIDSLLRAEAQHHATESTLANLEALRLEGMREAAGIESQLPDAKTDPSELAPESERS